VNTNMHNPQQLARVPEETYAHMVQQVRELTGDEPRQAEKIVAVVLGPAMLAPPRRFDASRPGCRYLYWSYSGRWVECNVRGDHDQHCGQEEAWLSTDPRCVDVEAWDA
jgi:hypothetical protein